MRDKFIIMTIVCGVTLPVGMELLTKPVQYSKSNIILNDSLHYESNYTIENSDDNVINQEQKDFIQTPSSDIKQSYFTPFNINSDSLKNFRYQIQTENNESYNGNFDFVFQQID